MPIYQVDTFGNTVIVDPDSSSSSTNVRLYMAFIDNAVGGETTLLKPSNAPPIPDDDTTELFIDGRKVRRGPDKVFTVSPDGSAIIFLPLSPGQDIELRFYGPRVGPQLHMSVIDNAVGGETTLLKPSNAPPIPDDDTTELFIDGRKVRRGPDKVFTVTPDGSAVIFAPLSPGQDVELRFYVI